MDIPILRRFRTGTVIVGVGLLFSLLLSTPVPAADPAIETIRQRVLRRLQNRSVNEEKVRQLMGDMTPEGSWPDIDYDDRSRSSWEPLRHLRRLQWMAFAVALPDSGLQGNTNLLDRIKTGFTFWFERDPESDNWWYGDIGIPKRLGPSLILLKDMLPEDLLRKGIEQMPSELRQHKGTDTDEVLNDEFLIHRGLVENNPDLIHKAFGHMLSELEVKSGIGIKADFGFHNHGPQLYSGSYGIGAVIMFGKWAYLARDTTFAFPRSKREILADFLLKGYRWMSWYSLLDYNTLGRAITRKGRHNQARSLRPALRKLAKLMPSKEKELESFRRHINGDSPELSGNKNFWLSDFMVHRRTNYYTSVCMTSEDVVGTEIGNGEGLQNYYLPYGSNLIFHGPPGEYRDIFPVWNWTRIPGVTAPHASTPPMPTGRTVEWGGRLQGTTDFAGGVSNGTHGLSAFDYDLDETSGRKSWFFLDRAFVCLGAGIQSGSDQPIITTVNQSLRDGDLLFAEGTSSMKHLSHGETRTMTSPARVHHAGVGYVFPRSGDRVHLDSSKQTGSWNRINLRYSKDEVSKRVFNLWLEHGKQPDDGSYVYVVAPGSRPDRLPTYLSDQSPIQVLSNTRSLQAVSHSEQDLAMMAFYRAGRNPINSKRSLSVDTPCLVIVARGEDGYDVSVANPEGDAANVQVRIHSNQDEEVIGERTFELPGGQQGGRSVTHTIELR